jgi:hypothetical protein
MPSIMLTAAMLAWPSMDEVDFKPLALEARSLVKGCDESLDHSK